MMDVGGRCSKCFAETTSRVMLHEAETHSSWMWVCDDCQGGRNEHV